MGLLSSIFGSSSKSSNSSSETTTYATQNTPTTQTGDASIVSGDLTKNVNMTESLTMTDFGMVQDGLKTIATTANNAMAGNVDVIKAGIGANSDSLKAALGFAADTNKQAFGFGTNALTVVDKTTSKAIDTVSEQATNALAMNNRTSEQAMQALLGGQSQMAKSYDAAIGLVGNIVSAANNNGNQLAAAAIGQVGAAYQTAQQEKSNAQIADLRIMVIGAAFVAAVIFLPRMVK